MDKTDFRQIAGAFLLSSILVSSPAEAQTQQDTVRHHPLADCSLLSPRGEVTAAFLGMLDSRIHGYTENLYTLSPSRREPYIQAAIAKNTSYPAHFIRAMFEGPYRQYDALKTEQERIQFLSNKLQQHHQVRPADVSNIAASCER